MFGESERNTVSELIGICNSITTAKKLIQVLPSLDICHPVHADMNVENGFTHIGNRSDCNEECGNFGGYVIEAITLTD